MINIRRIAKNTTVLLASQLIVFIFGFLFNIYSARYLGPELFGVLTFALSFSGIFVIFTDLGLNSLSTREVSRNYSLDRRFLGNAIILKLLLSIITFVFIVIIVNLLNYTNPLNIVVYLISISIFFGSFSSIIYSIFQAYEKMEYQTFGQITNSFLLLIGAIYGIHNNFTIIEFALLYFFVSLIVLILDFSLCIWKFTIPKVEFNLKFKIGLLKKSIPISLASIFTIISFKIDVILLSIIIGNLAVGYYTASYKLLEALMFIPAVFSTAIFPVFSKLHLSSKDNLKDILIKSIRYLSIISIPIAFVVTLLSNDIILIIYGNRFYFSIEILQILIWTIPIIFLTFIFRILMVSIDKQNLSMRINFLGMIFNIFMNIFLIPKYSYLGAALVTVLTELFVFILYYHYLSSLVVKIKFSKILIKPLFGSVIVAIFILLVKIDIICTIILSIIIYFIILSLLNTFDLEDKIIFKKIIGISKQIKRNNKKLNFLIINAHWNNRGDEAIIISLIDSLKNFPVNEISIMFVGNIKLLYKNVQIVDTYPDLSKKKFLINFLDMFIIFISKGEYSITKLGMNYIKSLQNTDVVIQAPGGPSIGSIYSGFMNISELIYLYRLLIPIIMKKPIYIYATSIGPFKGKLINPFRKYILSKINIIILREETSANYLEQLNLKSLVTADAAFQNNFNINKEVSEKLKIFDKEKIIGISLSLFEWHPIHKNNIHLKKRIKDSFKGVIEYLISKNYTIYLIPHLFNINLETNQEYNLLNEFKEIYGKIRILPNNYNYEIQQEYISKFYAVISMRYHPVIFAVKGNVPFISVNYEHKMDGLLKDLECEKYGIDIQDISIDNLIAKFNYLEQNHNEIVDFLKIKNNLMNEKSEETNKIIMDDLKKIGLI